MTRSRSRHVRRPPDLTSLFDVLFIVVFAALIRAAAVERAAETPPEPARPRAPVTPPQVAALRQQAISQIDTDLAARSPLVVRITARGTIEAIEVDGRRIALDVPLLEHSTDPDVILSYLGDRSAELRVCRIAALHLGSAALSRYLVIIAPAVALDDLRENLHQGLTRDLDRCQSEQHALAVLVDPTALPSAAPPPTPRAKP